MLFSQLKIGDHVHVLEVLGTFKKTTVYSLGSITQVSNPYDETLPQCKDILDQLEAQVEDPIVTNTIDNSKEINDLKNDVADIRKMIEDTKKMFMGGFPKPPMPPMPNLPAPMK